MDNVKTMLVCLFAIILCGCGPSASQIAEHQARQNFREAVAGVKVSTQGTTYIEFREKRLALETCYIANQSALNHEAGAFEKLARVMDATDVLWDHQIKYSEVTLPTGSEIIGGDAEWTRVKSSEWEAMLILNPPVAAKANFTGRQCYKDPDFYAKNYVLRGLTLVSKQCDELLADH